MELTFFPKNVVGLEHATPNQLSKIEISPSGFGLYFPMRDADLTGRLCLKEYSARRNGGLLDLGPKAAIGRVSPRSVRRVPTESSGAVRERRSAERTCPPLGFLFQS